jgi:hypothetical protein
VNVRRIQFSIADIFLATFVVGVICLGVQLGSRHDQPGIVALTLVFGIPMGIGSLLAGLKGLRFGFLIGVSVIGSIVLFAIVLLLMVLLAERLARWH